MEVRLLKNWKQDIFSYLPERLQKLLQHIDGEIMLEEIRVRANQPLQLFCGSYDRLIYAPGGNPAATLKDCEDILNRITEHSLYAWEDELKNGYLTLAGGYRVGVSGRVLKDENGILRITDFTSLNIRIARDCMGAAERVMKRILTPDGIPYPTLIISSPGCGKTTLLRDIARLLSIGEYCTRPLRVCVVDERMEISGSTRGLPQFDLGPRTDVLIGSPKPEGIRLAVRVLSPDVVVTDELGSKEDADAVQDASFCGVTTIATAHVRDIEALQKRIILMSLLYSGAFERLVLLGRRDNRVGEILNVFDAQLRPVSDRERGVLCFERSP